MENNTIKVSIENGAPITVARDAYAKAKMKQLREFGYTDLTVESVNEQIDALLAGKKLGSGLTVIGAMMEDEVLK